jgi:hypothetical protein
MISSSQNFFLVLLHVPVFYSGCVRISVRIPDILIDVIRGISQTFQEYFWILHLFGHNDFQICSNSPIISTLVDTR